MPKPRIYTSREPHSVFPEEPRWEPLRDLFGMELADWFGCMYGFEFDDGTMVHVYKHQTTRQSIHLGEDGRAFDYLGDHSYCELPRADVIDLAFFRWEEFSRMPSDPDPELQRRQLDEAVQTALAGEKMPWALRPADDGYVEPAGEEQQAA